MRNKKKALMVMVLMLIWGLFSTTVFASSTPIWKNAKAVESEDLRFKIEAPDYLYGFPVTAEIIPWDLAKIPNSDKYYITRAVELRILNGAANSVNMLFKPVRLCFFFDEVDYKRASNLNTSLPLGRFRVAHWTEATQSWQELPSTIFWNGSEGVIEAESIIGSGKYALLWNNSSNASLSPFAEDQLRLMVNYNNIVMPAQPYIVNGRTMVPLKVIGEKMGAAITWDSTEQRVDLVNGSNRVSLWIGSDSISKNGTVMKIEACPEIYNGSTYVPLRVAADAVGADLEWDQLTRTAKILSK